MLASVETKQGEPEKKVEERRGKEKRKQKRKEKKLQRDNRKEEDVFQRPKSKNLSVKEILKRMRKVYSVTAYIIDKKVSNKF